MKTTEWKDTEIGRIPKDWKVKPLGEIGFFSKGSGVSRDQSHSGNLPCIRYGEIYTSHNNYIREFYSFISPEIAKQAKRLKNGDILFAGSGETKEEIGKTVAFVGNEEAYAGGDIIVLSPNVNCSSIFLGFVLNAPSSVHQKAGMGQGDAIVHIHKESLAKVLIPFPPKEEQQRIANALSDIDMLIASLDKAIEKKRLVKQGAMQQLLTGKKRLKGFTGEWKKVKWSDLGYFVSGNTFPLRYQGVKRETYPFYKVSDMNNWGNENYMLRSNNYISEKTAKELSCNIIPADAIVFAKIGAAIFLERKRYTRKPCCIDNNMMAYIPMGVAKLFIWKLLETIKFGDYVDATALPSLSPITLGKITFYIPQDIVEQQEIANVLSMIDGEISSLTHEREKYLRLKDGMMQELLTGKTRLI